MNIKKLINQSIYFYRRTHLSVLLGTFTTTAILTGALVIGDSVRYSLNRIVLLRLGSTKYAINSGSRFFTPNLSQKLERHLGIKMASILKLNGIAINSSNQSRINNAQILGVDENFWEIGGTSNQFHKIEPNSVIINESLATRLKLNPGDDILVRIEKIIYLPAEIPFASQDNQSIAIRAKIHSIITESQFGRFNLRNNQISPNTVIFPYKLLTEQMELINKSNILLSSKNDFEINVLNDKIKEYWQPGDAQFFIKEKNNYYEITTEQVFLNDDIVLAAQNNFQETQQILTYFINSINHNQNKTPYSFVSAPGLPIVPKDMQANEIILNQWLAKDLKAIVGDKVKLFYFVPNQEQKLKEVSTTFIVHSIVPINDETGDKSLAPNFPGLNDAENCQDWDPGIPINLDDIREKDEEYWDTHHATPKAFITLPTAQALWGNRYGKLTSLRIPKKNISIKTVTKAIMGQLSPKSDGLIFQPVFEQGLASSNNATDFGQLFIGLSFFIIAASLLLTGLLFVLGIEQRKGQTAIMLSMGFVPGQIRNILLIEGFIIAILGGFLGVFGGILYNKIIVFLLSTIWIGTIGTSSLVIQIKLSTLITGGIISVMLAFVAMLITIHKQTLMSVKELQTNAEQPVYKQQKRVLLSLVISIISFVIVGFILFKVHPGRDKSATNVFWGAGFLMLMGTISFCNVLLSKLSKFLPNKISLYNISLKNIIRNRARSLATISLLSFGVFVIIGVGANRHDALKNADSKEAGTGGFTYWAETTIPLLQDMNSEKSQRQFGLKDKGINADFVSMKVFNGDDASCLNLNKISKPRILGVKPKELSGRFTFSENYTNWEILNKKINSTTIPAIADMSTIIWSLGKSLGDTVTYINDEGEKIDLKLVGGLNGSMLQGSLLISHKNFLNNFSTVNGTKAFMISVNNKQGQTMDLLSRTMEDYGLNIIPSTKKLAAFQALENTYLSIFLALGGLGLILGTIGNGILVMRNIMERRNELALWVLKYQKLIK